MLVQGAFSKLSLRAKNREIPLRLTRIDGRIGFRDLALLKRDQVQCYESARLETPRRSRDGSTEDFQIETSKPRAAEPHCGARPVAARVERSASVPR